MVLVGVASFNTILATNITKGVAKIRLRLVGVASLYWPRQIMIVQRRAYQLQKRSASYGCDFKLVIVPVHS